MILVEALLIWFAVSVPASLLIGRMFGAASSDDYVPSWSHESLGTGSVSP